MFESDIPLELARSAFQGVSFSPERRGDTSRAEYAQTLAADYAVFKAHAEKGGTLDLLDAEFAQYRANVRRRYIAYLASSARCISSFITGPSNFPVRRAQKRNDVAHRRLNDLFEFQELARRRVIRNLRPDLRPIMAGDADAIERLAVKLAAAERDQVNMKLANAAIRRSKKSGHAAQVAALMELGYPEAVAVELLKGDFAGRIGFADYQLTNNGANIRRMRERLEHLERNHAEPVREKVGNGVRLEDDPPGNRVRLFFPGKPDPDVRTKLKAHGFRWAPTLGAWQAYRNHNTLQFAGTFVANRGA
jgi:hypothetical protein